MIEPNQTYPAIIHTERGLAIAGTRITIYDITDYLRMDWPPSLIQHWLQLSDQQINDALVYIHNNRENVEAEYQHIIEQSEAMRAYWEERNRERLAQIAALPPKPGKEELYAKIQACKTELGMR